MEDNKNNPKQWRAITGVIIPNFKLYYRVIAIKMHYIGIKADTFLNEINQAPRYRLKYLWTLDFYIKKSEVFDRKKKAFPINGTDQSAYLQVEECQYIHIFLCSLNSSPSKSKPYQLKTRSTEPEIEESGE